MNFLKPVHTAPFVLSDFFINLKSVFVKTYCVHKIGGLGTPCQLWLHLESFIDNTELTLKCPGIGRSTKKYPF